MGDGKKDAAARWTCGRCRMSFRIGPPDHSDIERSRCPDCYRPFWHTTTGHHGGATALAKVGMDKRPGA